MNREIKFRAFLEDDNKIIDVKIIDFRENIIKTVNSQSTSKWNYSFDEIKFMQYTGLHDKNGVEIYEGDIIRYTYHGEDGEPNEYKSKKGVMNFKENQWCINSKHLDKYTMNFFYLEVIGNIYENKELLEVSDD